MSKQTHKQDIKNNFKKSIDEIIKLNSKYNKLMENISITDNAIYFKKKQITLNQPSSEDSNELATIQYVNNKIIDPLITGEVHLQHQSTSLSTEGNIKLKNLTLDSTQIIYNNENYDCLVIRDTTNNYIRSINCNILNANIVKYNQLDPPISLDGSEFEKLNIKCKSLDILTKNEDEFEPYNYLFNTYIDNENYDNSLITIKNLTIGSSNKEGELIVYVNKNNTIQPVNINNLILQNQNIDSIVSFVNSINNNTQSINPDYTSAGNIKANSINTAQLIVNNPSNESYNITFSTLPYYNGDPINYDNIDNNCFITKDALTKMPTNISRLELYSDEVDAQLNLYRAKNSTSTLDIGINIYEKSKTGSISYPKLSTHIDYNSITTKKQSNETTNSIFNTNINDICIGYFDDNHSGIKHNNINLIDIDTNNNINIYSSGYYLYKDINTSPIPIILCDNNKNIIQNINDIILQSEETCNLKYSDINIITANKDNDNINIEFNGNKYKCNNKDIIYIDNTDINIKNINEFNGNKYKCNNKEIIYINNTDIDINIDNITVNKIINSKELNINDFSINKINDTNQLDFIDGNNKYNIISAQIQLNNSPLININNINEFNGNKYKCNNKDIIYINNTDIDINNINEFNGNKYKCNNKDIIYINNTDIDINNIDNINVNKDIILNNITNNHITSIYNNSLYNIITTSVINEQQYIIINGNELNINDFSINKINDTNTLDFIDGDNKYNIISAKISNNSPLIKIDNINELNTTNININEFSINKSTDNKNKLDFIYSNNNVTTEHTIISAGLSTTNLPFIEINNIDELNTKNININEFSINKSVENVNKLNYIYSNNNVNIECNIISAKLSDDVLKLPIIKIQNINELISQNAKISQKISYQYPNTTDEISYDTYLLFKYNTISCSYDNKQPPKIILGVNNYLELNNSTGNYELQTDGYLSLCSNNYIEVPLIEETHNETTTDKLRIKIYKDVSTTPPQYKLQFIADEGGSVDIPLNSSS